MLEVFRAATPWLTLVLTLIMGLAGYIMSVLVKKVESLDRHINELQSQRIKDERYMQERYVTQEQFYRRLGEDQKIIEQVFGELRNINATLNQMIGEDRARRDQGKDES